MKNLILIVVAAALGFGGAYFIVTQKSESQLSALRAQVLQAKAGAPPAKDSPAEILKKLAAIDPNNVPSRPRAVRQIIFHLESLINAGDSAINPISDFIATGQDMDYMLREKDPSTVATFWDWHPGQPVYSGLVLPPSLRLSLVDVLRYIGGPNAEYALVTMLKNTSRAVEVAYIGQLLEKIAPGKYTDLANAMAKKVLLVPPGGLPETMVDAKSETYLYAMLNSRGDTSLVATAESKLMAKGPVDTESAEYLIKVQKLQALPVLAQAYTNASGSDKNFIANLTYNYIGSSTEADQIFRDWILNNATEPGTQSLSGRPRAAALAAMAGANFGPYVTDVPSDPVQIADRLALLNELEPQLSDPRLKQAIEQVKPKLQALLPH